MSDNKVLNVPNSLTLLRFILTPITIWLHIILGPTWKLITILLLMVGFGTDFADGWFARRFGLVTRFGQIFDPVTDFVAINSFNIYMFVTLEGLFSSEIVLFLRAAIVFVLVRYVFVAVTVARTEKVKPKAAEAIFIGKCSSALQMLVLTLFMSITAVNQDWWRAVLSSAFLAFFSIGILMALISATMYYLKYLEVKTTARATAS